MRFDRIFFIRSTHSFIFVNDVILWRCFTMSYEASNYAFATTKFTFLLVTFNLFSVRHSFPYF